MRPAVADGAMAELVELAKILDVGSPGRPRPQRCNRSDSIRPTDTGEKPSSQATLLVTLDGGAGGRH